MKQIRYSRPIMIVEDDPYIMNALTEVLSMMDRELIVARDGFEGIQKLKQLKNFEFPCCIILDLMMPKMTGEEFIFQIQALGNSELDSIPIIVSSAAIGLEKLNDPRVKYKLRKPVDIRAIEEIAETYH